MKRASENACGRAVQSWNPSRLRPRACARPLLKPKRRATLQEERRRILRELFGAGGETVWMPPPFFRDYGSNIELGERVFFHFNCIVLDVCSVRIGTFILFGPALHSARQDALLSNPLSYFDRSWLAAVDPNARECSRQRTYHHILDKSAFPHYKAAFQLRISNILPSLSNREFLLYTVHQNEAIGRSFEVG